MLDYHLHLWPHGERDRPPTVEEIASYVEKAASEGVTEIALTEHLFRFVQADAAGLGGWWENEPDLALQEQARSYWAEHNGADLDVYVECVLAAKAAGLPVVLGLEVDHYAGRMDKVARLLDGYPFDVLLGSVHWIGGWMFDVIDHAATLGEWNNRAIEDVWSAYCDAIEEIAASGAVDVLAHPDLCKITNATPAVPDEFHDRIADAAASSGIAAEINSAGWRKACAEPYPGPPLLRRFHERGVPLTTSSDGHRLEQVSWRVGDLRPMVEAAGYTELTAFRGRAPHPHPIG